MPFDAVFLSAVTQELQSACGARIDKIHQPERDTLVLLLRSAQGARRLLMTASPNRARVHFTEASAENPQHAAAQAPDRRTHCRHLPDAV